MYFVTRHPLASVANIRPFGSLEAKYWMNYSLLYIIIGLASIGVELRLTSLRLTLKRFIELLMFPVETKWFKLGMSICAVWSFAVFSFHNLFGVDLQAALVSQNFESEVNDWQDINFFDTLFVYVMADKNVVTRYSPIASLLTL